MDGESGLVQIAFELKTRLLDKLLVFGLAGNRRQLAGGVEFANPLQIDVEETVRARERSSSVTSGANSVASRRQSEPGTATISVS